MFKVDVGDSHYVVTFHYSEDKRKRRITTCLIHTVEETETEAQSLLFAEGFTTCSKYDNFNRFDGRKVALTRAISEFSKEARTLFWNAYWSKLYGDSVSSALHATGS